MQPGEGRGGTPLANSVELEQAARASPDTTDGQRFTDLFTVSQTRQHGATDSVSTSSQQQQQQQQQPPVAHLFLAR